MGRKTRVVDMVNGSIFKNMVWFVVPLILGNLLQLLYNAADLVVVSRFAGSNAMASVGATGSLNALIVSVFIGLSVGASVVVSRMIGARDAAGVHRAVHTSMLLAVVLGIVAMVVGVILSKPILQVMGTPKGDVLDGAVTYMRIYFFAVPAVLIYNFGASILRAIGDTKRPLYILAVSGIVNVILNLVLVIKFNMNVAGVAIATAVSNIISAAAVVFILLRADGSYKLHIGSMRFYKSELLEVIKVGLPAGIQSSLFSVSNALIQSAVNSFGTAAISGCAAAANIEGFVYTTMNAFYQATITGVSQNYGAKQEKRIYSTMKIATASVSVVGIVLGILTAVFAVPLLKIYITDSKEAIDYGVIRILVSGIPYFLCGIMEVMSGTLRGLGYSTSAMVTSLIGACGFRVLWVMIVLPLKRTLEVLFICWPISWVLVIVVDLILIFCFKKKAMEKMNSI